ncbi:MAG: RHS repeat-associated core domain-containing protein, partial [Syntrophomonadaceae bacterium]
HITPVTNINYYTWGLDLSGTLQGAGGVGGLLSDTKVSSSETNTYFSVGDANGTITEYVDNIGEIAAHGEHGAFGETKLSGAMKDLFTHWFSTKPFDEETGLVVYQRRYYDPILGRWLSNDPVGIKGGLNEFGFVNNDAINKWDKLGLWSEPNRKKWSSWAAVCASKGDKWEVLAKRLGLDETQAFKWVHNYDFSPKAGKTYWIPNVVVLYIAKAEYWIDYTPNSGEPWYKFWEHFETSPDKMTPDGANITRALAKLATAGVELAGYKKITLTSNSEQEFINSWRTKGLWGYIYGGHGSAGAVVVSPKSRKGVYASDVSPLYKPALISLFACESFSGGGWNELVSKNGLFFGYYDAVGFFSCQNIEVERGEN